MVINSKHSAQFPPLTLAQCNKFSLSFLGAAHRVIVIMLICILAFSESLLGAARTSTKTGDWNLKATWGGSSVPVAGDDVTIKNGTTLTITANAACASIAFGNNSDLVISGDYTLDVSGTFTMKLPGNNNPITFDVGTGTVTIEGLFTMEGGSGNANKRNDLTISTGTLNLNGGFTTATDRANVIFTGAGVLNISGAISANAMTLTESTGTVNYIGTTAQDIWLLSYYNLGVSGTATKTSTGTLTISNGLDVASGATLELSGTGTPLGFTGTISGTGTVLYSGASDQTISAATFPYLEFSGAGTKIIDAGTTVTVNNNWIVGSPTTMTTTAAAVVSGNISGSGSITMGSGSINIGGNWTNNGTFTSSTSTVSFTNSSSTDIPALNFYNLNLTGGPRVLAGTGSIGIAAAFTPGSGGFTVTGSTVNFNGSTTQTIPVFTFNKLILSGSDNKSIQTATEVTVYDVEIQGTAILDILGTGKITITK